MKEHVSHEYDRAIGSVVDARKQYDVACATHGQESPVTLRAREHLKRQVNTRNQMRKRFDSEKAMSKHVTAASGVLVALQAVESISKEKPLRIVLLSHQQGTAMSAEDFMAAKVRWAERAGYAVLSWQVPETFAPYNAIIRVSESGTEDRDRDYLAVITI